MANYTLACDSVVVVNPPLPDFKIRVPNPSIIRIERPDVSVFVRNPPRLKTQMKPPEVAGVVVVPVPGPPGPQGPPGDDGSGGFYYQHIQTVPSAGWTVHHGLNRLPNVSVLLGDETIGVAVQHIDNNTLYIPFSIPVTGKVICS
jgi:hypothetical protein